MYIACPKCDWRPGEGSKWYCTCTHSWNTFATQGVCPACHKVWAETQCHICMKWSDHLDWYHDEDGLTVDDYIANPQIHREPHKVHELVQDTDAQFEADVDQIMREHRWLLDELAKR